MSRLSCCVRALKHRLRASILSLLVRCRLNLLVSVEVSGVLIKHVCQDVLGIFEALHHFEVGRLHGRVERISASLAALIHVGDDLGLRAEHDLGVVLEVHLDYLVREAEHDGVPRPHPLLHIDDVLDATLSPLHLLGHLSVGVGLLCAFEVASEVL